MPAWLLAALRMLAGGAAVGTGFTVAEGFIDPGGSGVGGSGFLAGAPRALQGALGFGGSATKRRRRRRALTASDRADIAFIVGLLGPAAGKNFAVTLAGRAR